MGSLTLRRHGAVLDARDFGAACDGSTTDTTAIQAAIDFASAPLGDTAFRIGGSGTDYTLRVFVKGVLLGTTSTIAAAASTATIQAALEAISGLSGKVTVGAPTFGDGGSDAVFVRSLGHVMLLSSYHSSYPNGPIIYPRPGSRGPGGVVWVPGLAKIDATLRVYSDNVRIQTGRSSPGLVLGSGVEALYGGGYSSGIVWGGADAGGPMVKIQPVGSFTLSGVGFDGTLIAGAYPFTTAANTGLVISGVTASRFDHVHTVEFKADGVLMTTDIATRGDDYLDWSVSYCQFGFMGGRQWVNGGNAIRLTGDAGTAGVYVQNVYANTFDTIYCFYRKGSGLVMDDCDSNWFRNVSCIAHSTSAVALTTSAAADDIVDTSVTHDIDVNDVVRFVSLTGGAGLTVATPYYVISGSHGATTLQVSTTLAGSAVNFTTDITAGVITAGCGVLMRAVDAGASRLNHFDQVMCGTGGFVLEGTNVDTTVAHSVVVNHFYPNTGHHSGPSTPTLGAGTEATWNNTRSSGTDGYGSPPHMAADAFPW